MDKSKRMLATLLATLALHPLAWGQVTLRDAFAAAPDDIFPLLTRNNRLDCLDFAEGKVNMEVKNRGGGASRIDSLTQDYLRLQVSSRSRVEMRMLPATDTEPQRICLIRTYLGPAEDSQVSLYDTAWHLLGHVHRPRPEAFSDGHLSREAQGILTDLSLMWAAFTPDGEGLVWAMPLHELSKAQREEAREHLHTITTPITLKPYSK